jgi:hypothetical protein
MTDAEKIDRALAALRAERADNHVRPQPEIERNPPAFQKRQERERDGGDWSGSSGGGGVWAGRRER